MSPGSDVVDPGSPATPTQPLRAKRRRIGQACVSCRNRKSRCNGQRPKCSTCTDLDLACEYVSSGQSSKDVIISKRQFQAIEERLKGLESLLGQQQTSALPNSQPDLNDSLNTPDHVENTSLDAQLDSPSEGPIGSTVESEDPTDGMGHFVFADEEDRAFFGPSSSIAFTSDLSRALGRLSRTKAEWSSGHGRENNPPEVRIARISRHESSAPNPTLLASDGHDQLTPSVYSLPTEAETSALIDKYFTNTGLLFPYIHEQTFRDTYAQLKQNRQGIRRTWLGVLNMVLAMATHTSVFPGGKAEEREMRAEAYYRRANRLCGAQVMNGASLEIVQYLLLVSQYMQGTKSSIQTWTMHGLAVKVALQLGLHSTEASRRFTPVEREIRKRTWFGCVVLDRSLSMTFGRPASIPETYSRLELPVYFDDIELQQHQPQLLQKCRRSTDFFAATIELYSIMGHVIDNIYGGNLGCGDKMLPYELITSILKLRHQQDEWVKRLPTYMSLITAQGLWEQLGQDPFVNRFRIILTLRYHNVCILTNRIVLARLCELVGTGVDVENLNATGLNDIIGSTTEICVAASTQIIRIIHSLVKAGDEQRGMLGAWWFTLYYAFDAALVLSTILLLMRRIRPISLSPLITPDSLKGAINDCTEALRYLDKGNRTIDRCLWSLSKLRQVMDWIELNQSGEDAVRPLIPSTNPNIANGYDQSGESYPMIDQDGFMDQNMSFLDFDFMANERLDFGDALGHGDII